MHKVVSAVSVENSFFQHSSAAHGNGAHPLNRNVLPRRNMDKNIRPKQKLNFVGLPHKEAAPEHKLVYDFREII